MTDRAPTGLSRARGLLLWLWPACRAHCTMTRRAGRIGDDPSLPGGPMSHDEFFAIDTAAQPWDERYNPKLGKSIFRKDLYTDPETGAEIRLVRYPAGLVNP